MRVDSKERDGEVAVGVGRPVGVGSGR